jgi:hypothetical protein
MVGRRLGGSVPKWRSCLNILEQTGMRMRLDDWYSLAYGIPVVGRTYGLDLGKSNEKVAVVDPDSRSSGC